MARTHPNLVPGRRNAARIHGEALQCGDARLVHDQTLGASEVEQLAASIQCGRDARHQHRLLGIGRAAHAAVAQVPAAAHVARAHCPVIVEPFAAALEHLVVGVRRDCPGRDAQALLHAFEPGL